MRLTRKAALAAAVASIILPVTVGCNTLEDDDHYAATEITVDNKELSFVSENSKEYIASRSDFSAMNALFEKYGIYDEIASKGQLATILVIDNSDLGDRADFEAEVSEEDQVRAHISDIAISPSNLKDGDRLMMWHGKFVNISVDEQGKEGHVAGHVSFNSSVVKEVIKTGNGYVYVISDMISNPTSLLDYIQILPEEYSIFKNLVLSSSKPVFDKANSKPISVNEQGATVYDSVFITSNAYFENVGVDLNSEALTATLLLPSNDVIEEAIADAHARLDRWKMTREEDKLYGWILDACFLTKRYSLQQITDPTEGNSLKSMFSKVWRTDIQQMTGEEEINLSNAVVHKVKKLHIPNNALIYRLKDYFYYYEFCTAAQQEDFFKGQNIATPITLRDGNSAFTPLEALWPAVSYRLIDIKPGVDGSEAPFRLDFTPIRSYYDETGNRKAEIFLIPPGAYKFTMGAESSANVTMQVSVLVGDSVIGYCPELTIDGSTTYHYDRGAGGYPEGYDSSAVTALGGSKSGNYDRDGGPCIDEVVVPDLNGDGSAVRVTLRYEATSWQGVSKIPLHTWCFKPTVNNY